MAVKWRKWTAICDFYYKINGFTQRERERTQIRFASIHTKKYLEKESSTKNLII